MDSERAKIYDELSMLLTRYETDDATSEDLYGMLVKIQTYWEDIITKEA